MSVAAPKLAPPLVEVKSCMAADSPEPVRPRDRYVAVGGLGDRPACLTAEGALTDESEWSTEAGTRVLANVNHFGFATSTREVVGEQEEPAAATREPGIFALGHFGRACPFARARQRPGALVAGEIDRRVV